MNDQERTLGLLETPFGRLADFLTGHALPCIKKVATAFKKLMALFNGVHTHSTLTFIGSVQSDAGSLLCFTLPVTSSVKWLELPCRCP